MNKTKLFGSAMAVMMLAIVLSASIPVDAKAVPPIPINGLLVVKVFMYNQTEPNALVTATRYQGNSTYTIPFNNMTQDYRKSIPSGLYEVEVVLCANLSQVKYANITAGQTTILYFWFL